MANLSKDQVRQIIQNAPQGTSAPGIIAGLRSQGHILEGYDEIPNAPQKTTIDKISNFLDTAFGGQKIGELIGGLAAKGGLTGLTAEQRKLVSLPSAEAVTGDIARIGLEVAGGPILGKIGRGVGVGAGLARIGASTGLGAALGGVEALRQEQPIPEIAKAAAIGGAGGALVGGATEAISAGISKLPKILSYTSDTPEILLQRQFEKPIQSALAVKEAMPAEELLTHVQSAVRTLRKDLSQQYQQGSDLLFEANAGKRMGLDTATEKMAQKVAEEFGLDLPQNIKNISAKEGLDFYKEVNELFNKKAIQISPQGIGVRKLRDAFKSKLVASFEGVKELLSNYSTEKTTLDAMDMLVKSYQTKNPIIQTTALGRLKSAFNENKAAYISAIQEFEQKTGLNILDRIAAENIKEILPRKSGKFSFDELLRAVVFPVTSPKLVGAETRLAGRVSQFATQKALAPAGKATILQLLGGIIGKQ